MESVSLELSERRQLPLFSIGMVQKLTGLSARQIRYYEQHGLIEPARSEGKQRLFSFSDVERLMEIRRLLDDGLNMAGVKAQLGQFGNLSRAGHDTRRPELTDEEVYRQLQKDILEGQGSHNPSMFQGELSRFYRNPPGRSPKSR